jgi:hypothetical protein
LSTSQLKDATDQRDFAAAACVALSAMLPAEIRRARSCGIRKCGKPRPERCPKNGDPLPMRIVGAVFERPSDERIGAIRCCSIDLSQSPEKAGLKF